MLLTGNDALLLSQHKNMLLFDQNISVRLIQRLADLFPGATHVTRVGLDRASDQQVWEFAKEHDYAIVTKDSDFNDLSTLYGSPPKVIWLRIGNSSTEQIESMLRKQSIAIHDFIAHAPSSILEILA
jgi:predicted nuclease of predicted toxin-antitoxin system